MSIVEPERRTPIIAKVDVIVAGGGPAGIGAAVAAARNGADTLLIERYGFLGGMLTAGYVIGLHTDKTMPLKKYEEERPLIGGIAQELVEKLVGMRGCIPPKLWAKHSKVISCYTPADPEMTKIALIEMMEDADAKMLVHAYAVDAVVEDNVVKGVIIESKSGRQAVLADVVVDCTGDGDVAAAAGAPWEKATGKLLPMHLLACMGGVDTEKAKEYYRGSPALKEIYEKARVEKIKTEVRLPDEYLREARPVIPLTGHAGDVVRIPEWEKYWQRRNEVFTEFGGYWADCSDVRDLTEAELTTRKRILSGIKFVRKYVPGFEKCYLISTAPQIGVRESKRIMGDYILTWEEDAKKCLKHDDVICLARVGARVPEEAGPAFDVPYRCLVPKKVDGLLTAGRCISVDHELARRIAIRDEIQAIAFGEASGTAAALAVEERVKPRDIDVPTLQEKLRKQGLNVPER